MKATFQELWVGTPKFHLSPRMKLHFISGSQVLGSSRECYWLWNFLYPFTASQTADQLQSPASKSSPFWLFFTIVWNEKAWNPLLEACHSKQRKYQTGKTHLFSCSKANTTRGLHSISLPEIPISQYLVTQSECLTLSSSVSLKRSSALWSSFTCRSGQGIQDSRCLNTFQAMCTYLIEFLSSPSSEAAMGLQQVASETHSEQQSLLFGCKAALVCPQCFQSAEREGQGKTILLVKTHGAYILMHKFTKVKLDLFSVIVLMGVFTILFLDSFPKKMEICHQNSSIYIHTVVYVHSVPHLPEKAPPFKSQAHYIPSAFWLFGFNEFCAVHYCSNKKTWKRICCWLITCAKK